MQTIYIDISNKGVISTIYAKQGDVGRKFLVVFTNAGIPYNLEGAMLSAWYDGDSGEGNYTQIGDESAFSINGNQVEVEMIAQMLLVPGHGEMSLTLSLGEQHIGSWNIPYICEEKPGADSNEATEYYTAFTEVIDAARKFTVDKTLSLHGQPADAAKAGEAIAVERARINELVAMRGDAEVMEYTHDIDINDPEGSAIGKCTFRSNGCHAIVEVRFAYLYVKPVYPLIITFDIPESFIPLQDFVFVPDPFQSIDALKVSAYSDVSVNGRLHLQVTNTGDSTVVFGTSDVQPDDGIHVGLPFTAIYELKKPVIPELADIRVGADGTVYETAGEAVRGQVIGKKTEEGGIILGAGENTQAPALGALAMGNEVKATGDWSFAFGENSKATGTSSVAMGLACEAKGYDAFAMGDSCKANGDNSVAMGELSRANGLTSFSMGTGIVTDGPSTTAVGKWNEPNDALFSVGNGTSGLDRGNAFEVYEDGNAYVAGRVYEGKPKTYELIEDVTLQEDVTSFVRTADPNGAAYNFSAVRMQIAAEPASSSSQLIFRLASNESEYLIYHQQNNGLSTSARVTGLIARNDRGFLDYFVLNGTVNSPADMSARNGFADIKPWGNICGISIFSASSNVTIPAGSRIRIYAVRG